MELITENQLKTLFNYDPTSGEFVRLSMRGPQKAGAIAGTTDHQGYRRIGFGGKYYATSRLAALYMTGEWPRLQIDHINGIRDDNRWCNLRQVTNAQNTQNRRLHRKGSFSGKLGVTCNKRLARWVAQIMVSGKQKHLGLFSSSDDAHAAYVSAKRKLHQYGAL